VTEGTTTSTAPVKELHRSRDDRIVTGVAGGLGRYFDLPPIFFRVGFVVLALVGGAGILLYAAAALVIPDEGKHDSVAVQALRDHRDRPWLLIGVALVALATLSLIAQAHFWPNGGFAWALLIVGAIAIGWSQRRDREARPAVEGQPAPPRRPSIALPVFGLLLAAAGFLALLGVLGVDVPWDIALAVGAIAVGVSVAAGPLLHVRTGGLFVVGIVLAVLAVFVSTVDIRFEGSVGDKTVTPATASDLERNYDIAAGELVLDLRETELPAGVTHVDANVGVGQLTIRVPENTALDIDASAGAGELNVLGRHVDGWDQELHVNEVSPLGTSELVLDAHVGLGNVTIRRAGS
jgi:phage shock protein PspC (stress-responsive transcriptional regulator)